MLRGARRRRQNGGAAAASLTISLWPEIDRLPIREQQRIRRRRRIGRIKRRRSITHLLQERRRRLLWFKIAITPEQFRVLPVVPSRGGFRQRRR